MRETAKLGQETVDDIAGRYRRVQRDERDDRLIKLCQINNLVITNPYSKEPN